MALSAGQRLGPYEIQSVLGAGGMGEVYRARDTKLNRDVAIKVLPALFAADPDRFQRFTREAQTLAALNHPNIAHIHGLEESGDVRALVMELVEGVDLSQRIKDGPLPLDEALPIARQIADALEAAHDQGIVHRDLKPANVKVRGDGVVKVLDFGLAKAMDPAGSSGVSGGPGSTGVSLSPTLTHHATQLGMIIGTAAYMAPEQARGKTVDRRADIWAFGVVLYEMLTGKRAFDGDEASDVLASVLKSEPDFSRLPKDTPAPVRRLLRRCLEKDPRKRLSAIGDARLELDEKEAPAASAGSAAPAPPRSITALFVPALAGIVLTAIAAALLWPKAGSVASPSVQRLSILAPTGSDIAPDSNEVAISPDGRMVAFTVLDPDLVGTQLWVRSLDATASRRIEDTEGAHLPFWSPDGSRIGFFTSDKLKTVPTAGGRVEVLCTYPKVGGRGAAWSPANVIVTTRGTGGPLYRVSANGGDPVPATTLDATQKEFAHRFPTFLPDGEHFLYAALPAHEGKFAIFAGSIRDTSRTPVATLESAPVYAEPGYLLYRRQAVLVAQPFDAKTLKFTGEAVPLEDEPTNVLDPANSFTAGHTSSVSATGTLAYFSGPAVNTAVTWLDAAGHATGTLDLPAGEYSHIKISPDGSRAAVVRSISPTESNLWILDLVRGGALPLSSGPGRNEAPVWSPDGARIVFSSDRNGAQDFYVKTVADASPEQPYFQSDALFKSPNNFSADGRWLVFQSLDPVTAYDLWLLPDSGEHVPVPFVRGPGQDRSGAPSPDGHWIAYESGETGRLELYVQSFPEPGHKVRVSTAGAFAGWWTKDGRQLVFLSLDASSLWRADVQAGASLSVSEPKKFGTLPQGIVGIDAMPDRQRFVALVPAQKGTDSITIVLNWKAALDKKR